MYILGFKSIGGLFLFDFASVVTATKGRRPSAYLYSFKTRGYFAAHLFTPFICPFLAISFRRISKIILIFCYFYLQLRLPDTACLFLWYFAMAASERAHATTLFNFICTIMTPSLFPSFMPSNYCHFLPGQDWHARYCSRYNLSPQWRHYAIRACLLPSSRDATRLAIQSIALLVERWAYFDDFDFYA